MNMHCVRPCRALGMATVTSTILLPTPFMSGRSRHGRTCSSTTTARVSRSSSSRTSEPGHQTSLVVPQGRQFGIVKDGGEANLSGRALAGGHAGDPLFPWVSVHSSMRQ